MFPLMFSFQATSRDGFSPAAPKYRRTQWRTETSPTVPWCFNWRTRISKRTTSATLYFEGWRLSAEPGWLLFAWCACPLSRFLCLFTVSGGNWMVAFTAFAIGLLLRMYVFASKDHRGKYNKIFVDFLTYMSLGIFQCEMVEKAISLRDSKIFTF